MARSKPHPGKVLKEEYLLPCGMSARRLAAAIDVAPNRITAIINGDRSVTADTAIRLGRFFRTTSEFWLNLQAAHDLSLAERRTSRSSSAAQEGDGLVDVGVAFVRELLARSNPRGGRPADKEFIDGLYEDR